MATKEPDLWQVMEAYKNLDRNFGRAVASALDNPQRLQDLRRVYEQEKNKILES